MKQACLYSYFLFFSVTFTIPRGKLTAIVGQVGSGKSSIVNALLGELVRHEGDITINVS